MATRTKKYNVVWLVGLFVVFFVGFILYPIIRATYDFEISYNEGWDAYHQLAAIQGHLYPLHFGYVVTNYTPISFYIVGYLSLHGDPIIVGRVISIASFFVIVVGIGAAARNIGVSRVEASLASMMCIALLGAFHGNYVGVDDPQLLGTAVAVIGFIVWSHAPRNKLFSTVALCIFLVSGLIKETNFVIPLSIGIELFFRNYKDSLRFCITGIVFAVIATVALYILYGPGFFSQLLSPRRYSIHDSLANTLHYTQSLSAGLPLVVIILLMNLGFGGNRLILIYLVVGLCVGGVLSGGAGTSTNMFIDVTLALSLATASIVRWLREGRQADNRLIGAFIAMSIYGPVLQLPAAVENFAHGVSNAGSQSISAKARAFHDALNFMKDHPGEAFCQSTTLCFRAGRRFTFDPFNAPEAINLGRLREEPFLRQIEHKRFAVIELGNSVRAFSSFSPPSENENGFMQNFLRAVETGYYLAAQEPPYTFFLPKQ